MVGAGAAGLYAALCAARERATVVLVSATPLAQTASYWAQGGLAAALAADDSFELHLSDTELAGRALVRHSAAEVLVHEAPDCVRDLQALGVRFDADRFGRLALGLEGGHSVRRVVHAGGSATGRRVVRQLSALAAAEPRITVLEGARARALWRSEGRCRGLICEDGLIVSARAVVLGTGGAAALWARTTNPPGSQGVGLLLAHAAGAALADLELLQFHPTAVIGVRRARGLPRDRGDPRRGRHPARRLRRAVRRRARPPRRGLPGDPGSPERDRERSRWASTCARSTPPTSPTWSPSLREAGLDPVRELIPVAPAAHYTMGGIVADLHARSTLPGLYAVGESSCTGLHGANRLASNSLSECFVFARRADRRRAVRARAGAGARGQRRARGAARARGARRSRTPPRARRCGATRASCARARALTRLLDDPHPLARLIARCALDAHREPRRPPALGLPRARSRPSITATSSSRASTPSAWQTWT